MIELIGENFTNKSMKRRNKTGKMFEDEYSNNSCMSSYNICE